MERNRNVFNDNSTEEMWRGTEMFSMITPLKRCGEEQKCFEFLICFHTNGWSLEITPTVPLR